MFIYITYLAPHTTSTHRNYSHQSFAKQCVEQRAATQYGHAPADLGAKTSLARHPLVGDIHYLPFTEQHVAATAASRPYLYSTMATSHVDGVNVKTWTFSIVCALLTFINVVGHLIASNFPDIGYPCVYSHVVDYDQLNMSRFNEMHMLTPQLYLDQGQIIAYVCFSIIVFMIIVIYYIVCWVKIFFRNEKGLNLNQSTRDITCMGDSMSCFLYTLCMDTFQLFTITLSFRLPSMIAFTYCLHFICLSVFSVTMLTQYQSYERWSFSLSKIHPNLQGAIKFKTLVVNLVEMLLGFSTMVLAMSLCLGFGNNFFIRTGHMVIGTLITFSAISSIYMITIEAVLYRYMKVQFGYHIGAFFGICGALYPVLRYESVSASEYAQSINIFIAMMFVLWTSFMICRIVRFFMRRQRQYRSLPNTEEIQSLKKNVET